VQLPGRLLECPILLGRILRKQRPVVNDRVLPSSTGTKNVTHAKPISASEICSELERILSSGIFATADRMKRFLRFVVKETLDGRGDELNELQLGAEVYDRNEKFDPRVDSIVRVDAGRLRSKLREFYLSEGRSSSIRIDIPKGSYKPSFKQLRDCNPSRLMHRSTREQGSMKTVAVLPLADLSPHGDQGHFGDGVSEELAFTLCRVRNLRVISQTSALAFTGRTDVREIGRELGVKFVVEGSVRKAKQRLRVMVRLAEAATGFQIWSEAYTCGSSDVFAAQEEISRAVTMALRTRVWGEAYHQPRKRRASE
jgi:adenylate cyclase